MAVDLQWSEDNVPYAPRFGDSYFSKAGGRAETEHVFLSGNDLPRRWLGRSHFSIGELGFGTGLNFFHTLWRLRMLGAGGQVVPRLRFVSFEMYPLDPDDMRRCLREWPELLPVAEPFLENWALPEGWSVFEQDDVVLQLAIGDAGAMIGQLEGAMDCWYLDGFSPAKNPGLWSENLLGAVALKTAEDGSFATYTAAGWVRRNLENAGFNVVKCPGFAGKRDMSRGVIKLT